MQRTFAIGDIHGCAKTLKKLLLEEIKINEQDEIYFLGDYIDRGPDSKGVIDFILELQNKNYRFHTLRGNHEQLFMESEISCDAYDIWIANGGLATLQNFGVPVFSQLKKEYKTFFENTKYYVETNDFIFVHAGLNFESIDIFQDKESMLWIRVMRVNKKRIGSKIIIHGHTPTPLNEVKRSLVLAHKRGSVNIDTGCVMKNYYELGFLSALEVETMQLYSVKNID